MIKKLKNLISNIFYLIKGFILKRDPKIALFGSWGGKRFADNSRFLFQYLSENKEKYGFTKIIWVTRDSNLNEELKSMGYDSILMGTKESRYWHLKAGIHFLSNMCVGEEMTNDIETKYSPGATRVQLWHGAGIKACNGLKNSSKKIGYLHKFYLYNISWIFSQGFWGKCYYLAISNENKRVVHQDYYAKNKHIIMASYPRFFKTDKYLKTEENIIERLSCLKKSKRLILYLPTFRENIEQYVKPEEIEGFNEFLDGNKLVWIQKTHSADVNLTLQENSTNVISLPSAFDISIIYDYIDLFITDYSSSTTDAIFRDIMTMEYCPDYNYYSTEDRGFVSDYDNYHIGNLVTDPNKLFDTILSYVNCNPTTLEKHKKTKKFLVGEETWTMEKVTKEILKKIRH